MRTAITIGKRHGAGWVLVGGPDVPVQQQLEHFRSLHLSKAHEDFEQVIYQESDQAALRLHFRTPEAEAEHHKRRDEESAALKKSAEPKPVEKPPEPEPGHAVKEQIAKADSRKVRPPARAA